jgi:MFS family permease
MTTTISPTVTASDEAGRRRSIAFLNWAHALDHFVLLIYPTVVIGLEVIYQRPYAELIALSTASFVAFGVFSLPAGWLADRWSRRNMMAMFYIGCGVSLLGVSLSPNLLMLAVAMFALGVFAAIYHPVGMPMLLEASQAQGRTVAFNGVCGNLGAALASGIAAAIASWFGWRAAFMVPATVCIATGIGYLMLVPDDRHRTATRKTVADVVL